MTIRVASLGMGWVTREVWLPRFSKHNAFELIAGVDPSSHAVSETLTKFPEIVAVKDTQQLIQLCPDLVIVATPNYLHIRESCELLANGISVLVEKPICLHSHELGCVREILNTTNAHFITSHASRLRKDVESIRKRVDAGDLGQIRLVEVQWVRSKGIPRPGTWFTHKKYAGGGVVYDLGWHALDTALSLINYPKPKNVTAVLSDDHIHAMNKNQIQWRHDTSEEKLLTIDVEDCAMAFINTESGVGVHFHTAWASHNQHDYTNITVHGTKGSMSLHTTFGFSPNRVRTPKLLWSRDGDVVELDLPDVELGDEYDQQVNDIVSVFKGEHSSSLAVEQADAVVQTIEGIYEAHEKSIGIPTQEIA